MRITKPDDVLLLQGFERRGEQCYLIISVGYVVEADNTLVLEKDAWKWLAPLFPDEPFDLGQQKRRGTFAVSGSAYALNGHALTQMAIRVRFGQIEKTLHVHGNRQWEQGLTTWHASSPAPFTRMPVDLAHAMGCKDHPSNPYGKGLAKEDNNFTGVALPNIEWPDKPILSIHDRPTPATLGNLPASDPAIARWAGTFDTTWENTRFPWLPDNVDPRYFDRVSQDQCITTYWKGNEQWSIEGMHKEHALISGTLPNLQPALLWLRGNDSPWSVPTVPLLQSAELTLDTVWLFPDSSRQLLLYRAAIPVQREDGADLDAIWINTWPAGASLPSQAEKVAAWAKQVPEIAPQLALASAAGIAGLAASAPVAAAATTNATGASATALSTLGLGDPKTTTPSPVDALTSTPTLPQDAGLNPADSLAGHNANVDSPALSAQATSDTIQNPNIDAAPTAWSDTFWNDICNEYGKAWDDARNVVRKMQEEQAAYGAVFPEVEPFIPPPKPVPTAQPISVSDNLTQEIAQKINAGLEEGQRVFKEILKDNYPNNPQAVEAILSKVQQSSLAPISEAHVTETLSNLPPALRAQAESEYQALSKTFDDLNKKLASTFYPESIATDTASLGQAGDSAAKTASNTSVDDVSRTAEQLSPTGPASDLPINHNANLAQTAATDVTTHASTASAIPATTALASAGTTSGAVAATNFSGKGLEKQNYSGSDLSQANFAGANLVGCDFSHANLSGASFAGARLESCDFSGAKMDGTHLYDMDARDTNFSQADWRNAQAQRMSLASCNLDQIDATEADLTQTQLDQCTLNKALLVKATLAATTFSSVQAVSLTMSDAKAPGLRIDSGTTLDKASFERASLETCSFQKSFFPNSNWTDANINDGLLMACDLSGMQAQRLQARRAVFKDSQIRDANWQHANLMEASFDYAILERIDASGSNLHGAQTRTATVRSIKLDDAVLSASRLLQEHGHG